MNAQVHPDASKPWYQQRWLWFVLSVPITSVILSSIMVYVAVMGRDTLVNDNYYKDGMEINQTINQDLLADELALRPRVSITSQGQASVHFSSSKLPKQAFVTLKIVHPTVGSEDILVKLLPTADGFMGDVPSSLEGRRYIDLYAFDESWRIREEVVLPLKQHVMNNSDRARTLEQQMPKEQP